MAAKCRNLCAACSPISLLAALLFFSAGFAEGRLAGIRGRDLESQAHPSQIRKRVFSNHTRFVFVAGLEGSGHHAWNMAYDRCLKSKTCRVDSALNNMLYQYNGSGLFNPEKMEVGDFCALRKRFVEGLRRVAAENSKSGHDSMVLLNAAGDLNLTGMVSYPNFVGTDRAFHKPDVRLLAQICEEAGVDLRIIVATRPARELMPSVMDREYEGSLMREYLMMNTMADALFGQMASIDQRFLKCVEAMSTKRSPKSRKEELGEFLLPALVGAEAGVWDEMLSVFHPLSKKHMYSKDQQIAAEMTLPAIHRVDSYCSEQGLA